MKKALFITTIIGGSFLCTPVFSQEKVTPDSLGLPGDNLNLYGVLDIFQKSETLEEFEKKLNAEDSKINNLDLNGNDKIDYITVKDNMKGNAHAIVLQVAVNEKETQDVAVIEVEKDKNDKIQIQIVGDEQLYGKNYIIEPKDDAEKTASGGTPNPGYKGAKSENSGSGDKKTTTVTNNYYNTTTNVNDNWHPVQSWSIFHYLFFPTYVVYVSPWSWGYYPGYWSPWTPLYWHSYYYGYHYPHHHDYYGYYHRSDHYRNTNAHEFYGQRRTTSTTVNQRREKGEYKNTYSREGSGKANEGHFSNENKGINSSGDNNKSTKEGLHKGNGNEKNVPSGKNSKTNRINNNQKSSPSVKQNRSSNHNSSPGSHSAPRSGSKSGNKGSGSGKKR